MALRLFAVLGRPNGNSVHLYNTFLRHRCPQNENHNTTTKTKHTTTHGECSPRLMGNFPIRWGNHHLRKITAAKTIELVENRCTRRGICTIFAVVVADFFEMVIFPIRWGNSPSHVFRETWEMLRGKKEPKIIGAITRKQNARTQINLTYLGHLWSIPDAFLELTAVAVLVGRFNP